MTWITPYLDDGPPRFRVYEGLAIEQIVSIYSDGKTIVSGGRLMERRMNASEPARTEFRHSNFGIRMLSFKDKKGNMHFSDSEMLFEELAICYIKMAHLYPPPKDIYQMVQQLESSFDPMKYATKDDTFTISKRSIDMNRSAVTGAIGSTQIINAFFGFMARKELDAGDFEMENYRQAIMEEQEKTSRNKYAMKAKMMYIHMDALGGWMMATLDGISPVQTSDVRLTFGLTSFKCLLGEDRRAGRGSRNI